MTPQLSDLQLDFKKCSDCMLHPEYTARLHALLNQPLTQELVDYLCEKATSTKHWPELRFAHLRILLLNSSSRDFDMKQWYFDSWKKSRRLWLRMYYLRGYAMYATEREMETEMKRFVDLLRKNHDYQDYEDILSCAGLPYLAREYGYPCFHRAIAVAREEYEKIDPLLRGWRTTNERLESVELLSKAEIDARNRAYLAKHHVEAFETAWPTAMQCDTAGIHQDTIRLEPGRLYSITIGCSVFREDLPTVPTLSVTDGSEGYIQFDTSRFPATLATAGKKSTKLSAHLNTKVQAPFIVCTADGELNVTFQSWVLSADRKSGAWHESTTLPALSMQKEQISHNKIRYGCNAAGHPDEYDCFVFTVEWKPLQKKG